MKAAVNLSGPYNPGLALTPGAPSGVYDITAPNRGHVDGDAT
jgi:hypothetical protein